MAIDTAISADTRSSLLSLQKTAKLVETTQQRLSTGLKVSSAVDDAVAYFTARSLGSRATDLLEAKDGIGNGISTIKATMTALESAEKLVVQMKGIALAAKSAESTERGTLATQFDQLRDQLDHVTADASYQGVNLLANPPSDLTVRLNESSAQEAHKLTVSGKTITSAALGITGVSAPAGTAVTFDGYNNDLSVRTMFDDWRILSMGNATDRANAIAQVVSITGFGPTSGTDYWTANDNGFDSINIGADSTVYGSELSAAAASYYSFDLLGYFLGGLAAINMSATADGITDAYAGYSVMGWENLTLNLNPSGSSGSGSWTGSDYLTQIDATLAQCDTAISTIRTTSSNMGANLALLQVRQGFTSSLSNLLKEGAGKLVDANLNEEGANMVTLQTRSQLGMSALSFSGQAAQSILSLF